MASSRKMSLEEAARAADHLKIQINQYIFGQERLITEALCTLLAGGHILITGAPGLAKTTLVRVISTFLGLSFGRIQFTPDLLPSDIIGSEILNIDPQSGQRTFLFCKGPVFANLLLADEINRASPRTQSALLEAMQERTCTVAGKGHKLPLPFMVFATQNPFESEGTFPLPEAQMDRFLLHTFVSYPDELTEKRILEEHVHDRLVGEQTSFERSKDQSEMSAATLNELVSWSKHIRVDEEIVTAINELVRSTRPDDMLCPEQYREAIWYGAGPRAGISLISSCRSLALLNKSEGVRWEHVRRLAKPALRHRIRLTLPAGKDGFSEDQLIEYLLTRLEDKHKNLARGIR